MTPKEIELADAKAHIAKLEDYISELEGKLKMKRSRRPVAWGEKDDARLQRLHDEDHTASAIIRIMKKDKKLVYRKMDELGLKRQGRKVWTKDEMDTIEQGVKDNLSSGQIAAKLPGRTPEQVNTKGHLMGLKFVSKIGYRPGELDLP